MASRPGNRVIEALRRARIIYWRHHDRAIDHFVLHHLFEAVPSAPGRHGMLRDHAVDELATAEPVQESDAEPVRRRSVPHTAR
jgi:hypothetical protein